MRRGRGRPAPRSSPPHEGAGGGPRNDADAAVAWVAGRHAVLEALERSSAGASADALPPAPHVERIVVSLDPGTDRWWRAAGADLARRVGSVVVRAPRRALDDIVGGVPHQGVAARMAAAPYADVSDVISGAASPGLFVLVDGVEDPRNLGAIIRSAAAAGADGVVIPERRSAGLSPATAKAAAGAIHRIPLARAKNVQRALEAFREAGAWTVGLVPAAPPLWDVADLTRPTCLVVGGEGSGLSRLARERCDVVAGIPTARGVESLNAAVAAAIALFEAVRQRRTGSEQR